MRQITKPLTHPLQTFEEQGAYDAALWPTFDDWWDLYAKKIDRKKCERRWDKMTQGEREAAMAHTEAYIAATPDLTFRRHPYTYLHNENWNDEQLTIRSGPAARSSLDRARGEAERLAAMYRDQTSDHERS